MPFSATVLSWLVLLALVLAGLALLVAMAALRIFSRGKRVDERLDRYTGKSVVLTTPNATPRQLDGDTVGSGKELRATIEPGLLLVRVPR